MVVLRQRRILNAVKCDRLNSPRRGMCWYHGLCGPHSKQLRDIEKVGFIEIKESGFD